MARARPGTINHQDVPVEHYFAGNPFDRGEAQRRDAGWLDNARRDPTSRFLPLHRLQVLVDRNASDGPRLGWAGPELVDRLGWDAPDPVFLGIHEGVAHFAIDVTASDPGGLGLSGGLVFEEARALAASLPMHETGIIAQAKAQIDWHARHRFCGVCGAETQPERGGGQRRCRACNAEHFPRTDPVIIALVHDGGDRCLLGQSRLWGLRGSFYSCLSGFMDHGESIEEAVRREVAEEAGIELAAVRYHSSQPWPFPSSLMIGCHALAATTDIHFDAEEMTDVRWFTRDEIQAALRGENPALSVPGKIAIGHWLVKTWADGEAG